MFKKLKSQEIISECHVLPFLFLFNERKKTNHYYHKIFWGIGPGNEDKMVVQRKLETIDLWHAFNRIL